MFFGAKEFYDMYYITLLLLETSLALEISGKTKFQSPFFFIFFYIIDSVSIFKCQLNEDLILQTMP